MISTDAVNNILNEQVEGYRGLLDLLQRERACLIDFDAEAVERLSKEKDTIVLKLKLREEERKRLSGGISIQRLYEITGDSKLPDIRLKLISLIQGIEELNEFNRLLIDRSLNYVRSTSEFLGALGMNCSIDRKGAIISRET
ncbi:MAG: flagellar protein FlgN [Nitrospirae bacterium]|nr:flagellar protein FlgN [Nitrospirota bacterium]